MENSENTSYMNAWDADFAEMNQNSIAEDGGDQTNPIPAVNIKRPIHKSPPLKMMILFFGVVTLVGGVAFAFFGNTFTNESKIPKAPKPAPKNTLSTSDQERLANAEAANAMRGNQKAFEAHSQDKDNQDKKELPKAAQSTDTDQKTPPEVAKPSAAAPIVQQQPVKPAVAAPSVVYQPPKIDKPIVTPNNSQDALTKSLTAKIDNLTLALQKQDAQAKVVRSTQNSIAATVGTKEIPRIQQQPTRPLATPASVVYRPDKNQEALIKSLAAKIDGQAIALQKQDTQLKNLQGLEKPVSAPAKDAAPAPIAQVAELEKPPAQNTPSPPPQIQQVAQILPSIDGRATAKLFDPVTVSTDGNSAAQNLVRIQLSQSIPTNNGLEIPAGSIVAMNIAVASNGMVTGSSVGVWDLKTQKQLNVPQGSLVIEGLKGQPLIAQSIKTNDGGAQAADTQAAIWGAIGAGVDGLTRPDSSSTITAGTIASTSTSGGSRDVLVNAAGGFARAKANSIEKDAAKRRDKLSAQAELWYLPQNTEVVVSARPLLPGNSKFLTATDNQRDQPELLVPKRYVANLYRR
jgi:hypothetical protein